METTLDERAKKKDPYRKLIVGLSILIPLVVGVLFRVKIPGYDLSFLPPIYATLNGLTAVALVAAVVAIKNNRRKTHEALVNLCLAFSSLFLIMYVAYHMTSDSTPFGGQGSIRYIYYFILITHILLSVVVIPFVMFTYVKGFTGDFKRHRKLAKITFPLWLYVAVTGVIVYILISPYYS
jgi:putative membrane protein